MIPYSFSTMYFWIFIDFHPALLFIYKNRYITENEVRRPTDSHSHDIGRVNTVVLIFHSKYISNRPASLAFFKILIEFIL